MTLFHKITNSIRQSAEKRARARDCEQLLKMSDRQLADCGFSRLQLLDGVDSWPWRVQHETNDLSSVVPSKPESASKKRRHNAREIRKAIKELSAYSDRELTEMGITRGSIKEVVRTGRASVENVPDNAKHAA
ncbi:MAG: hypothetical protein AB8B97_16775 [Granulosicoccus sp.]